MSTTFILGIISGASMLLASIVPLYVGMAVKHKPVRALSLLLGLFSFTHGLFHVGFLVGIDLVSIVLIEPASVSILLIFMAYYLEKGGFG